MVSTISRPLERRTLSSFLVVPFPRISLFVFEERERERGLIMLSIESRVDSVTRAEEEKSVPRKGGVDKGGSLSFRVYYALLRGGYRDATV